MDSVKKEVPNKKSSSDSEARNVMESKQSCPIEPLSPVKQELVNTTDDYVSRSVDYPTLNNEDSIELYAVKVEPVDIAIELDSPAVAHVNIKVEPKQEVVERSCTKHVFEKSEDITQKNAQYCKNYRQRKKSANQDIVKKKTNAEYCRMYRQRKQLLAQQLQSENEILHTPSTSSLQMTFEPHQPITTDVGSYGVDMVVAAGTGVADTLGGATVEPVLELIKCEPELIQGLDECLPHQSTLGPTRAPADRLSTKANVQVDSFKNNSSTATEERLQNPNMKTSVMPYQCNKCSFSFSSKYFLKLHDAIHTGAKPFQCDKCSYSTATKCNLKQHANTHTGVKPFQCDKCSYSSAVKYRLEEHAAIHTGVKPFQCDICSYSAASKNNLNRHATIHTGVKRLHCDLCDYATNRKEDLEAHLNMHYGIRPFRCDQCSYSAAAKGSLKVHAVLHTKVKAYKCDHCSYSCATFGSLKKHALLHTGNKP